MLYEAPARHRTSLIARLSELRLHQVGLILMPLAAAAVAFVQPVDFDYWWHRRTGEYIVSGGGVPHSDIFSFTVPGRAWVDHEWLAQIVMYGIDASLGYAALFVAFVALGFAAHLLVFRLLRSRGATEMQALLLTLPIAVFGAMYWRPRPAMFTVLLMTLFLVELTRARNEPRRLWHLPVIIVIWSNLHGGYVLGLGLLAMFVIAQRLDRPRIGGTTWRHAATVLLLSFAATIISPYTYHTWLYPLSYLVGDNASLALIDEWKSANFHEARSAPFALLLLATMAVGVTARRFDAWRLLVMLTFAAMALHSMRHQPLFAIVWSVMSGMTILDRWPTWGGAVRSGSAAAGMNWAILAGGVAALCTVIAVSPQGLPLRDAPSRGSNLLPVAGADYIIEHDPGARVFNEYAWGGYLIDRLYPEGRVFIDGRADVYGALVPEYVRATRGDGWQPLFEEHGVEMALLPPYLPLVLELRNAGWRSVVMDSVQVLLISPEYEPSR